MIRSLTTVKRRGLQFAVALMSAALLIGMSAGLSGSKAFAATATNGMYDWEFNSASAPNQSMFNSNDLTFRNSTSASNGSITIGGTAPSGATNGNCAMLTNPVKFPGKASGSAGSITIKFSANNFSSADGSNFVLLSNTISGDGSTNAINAMLKVYRPSSDEITNLSLPDNAVQVDIGATNAAGVFCGRSAFIPNVTDDMIKAGVVLSIKMDSTGTVSASINGDKYYVFNVRTDSGVATYTPTFDFDFTNSVCFNTIGYRSYGYNKNSFSIDYVRFNTDYSNGIYTNSADNSQLYGDVANNGTPVLVTNNGDGTYKYNNVNYKWNSTTQKFDVYTAASTGTGTGTGTTVTPVKITVAKATVSKAAVGKKSVKTTWKAVSGATGYQVSVNTKKSGTKIVKTITSGKTVTYNKTKLKKGKVYYVSVRAFNTSNGTTTYGSWSAVKKTAKVK